MTYYSFPYEIQTFVYSTHVGSLDHIKRSLISVAINWTVVSTNEYMY